MEPLFQFLGEPELNSSEVENISLWLVEKSQTLPKTELLNDESSWDGPVLLSPFAKFSLKCTIFFLDNRWQSFLDDFDSAITCHLERKDSSLRKTDFTVASLYLFAWVAARRLGKMERESQFLKKLKDHHLFFLSDLNRAFLLEAAREKMSKGCYLESLETLDEFHTESRAGAYWEIQSYVIRSTCLQALGKYSECKKVIQKLSRFQVYGAPFRATLKRKQLSFLVETENYKEAIQLAKNNSHLLNQSIPFQILFKLELLRCEIALGKFHSASEIFREVNELRIQGGLTDRFASFLEEESELALLGGHFIPILPNIQERIWQAQLNGDFAAQCVLLRILGRTLASTGKVFEARRAIESSLLLADSESYGRAKVLSQLNLGLAFLQEDRPREGYSVLLQVAKIAQNMDLKITAPLAEALYQASHPSLKGFKALSQLFEQAGSLSPFLSYLKHYQLTEDFAVVVHELGVPDPRSQGRSNPNRANHPENADPHTLWTYLEMVFISQSNVLFIKENILIYHENSCPIFLDIPEHSKRIFHRLLGSHSKGVTLQELFKELEPKISFKPDRHKTRVTRVISFLRAFLKPIQATIERDQNSFSYALKFNAPLVLLKTSRLAATKINRLSPTEEKILSILTDQKQASTTQLRNQLGQVSRQALHKPLKNLQSKGLVRFKSRGRSSFYYRV